MVATVLLAGGCGWEDRSSQKPSAGAENAGPGRAVEAFDFGFKPTGLTVKHGTTVEWTNTGQQIHTVKQLPSSGEKFFSKALDAAASYRHRFARRGDHPYFCTLHPQMKGTISVR